MLSYDVVFTQILIILLYVAVGFAAGRAGLVNPEQRRYLTKICTDLIMPFTVLSASSQNVSAGELAGLGGISLLILLQYVLTTSVCLIVQKLRRTPRKRMVTTASLVTYPNCTFLGLPLCQALFGNTAILYNAVALVAFNVLFFTWQYSMFTGKKMNPKNLVTPPTVATAALIVMLAANLRFPAPVQTVVGSIGSMVTPLSLIIIGVMMSESRVLSILQERRAYLVTLLRNVVMPFLFLGIVRFIPIPAADRLCLLVYMSCPCATLTSIYAIQTDSEPEFAANSVLMSTLFFALTLPLMIFAGQHLLSL